MDNVEKLICTGVNSYTGKHTHSTYELEHTKQHGGLCATLTYTFTVVGSMAPAFVTVLISEKEIPKDTVPSGMIHIPIEGLVSGGSGVLVGLESIGHLLFICNDDNGKKDKNRFR